MQFTDGSLCFFTHITFYLQKLRYSTQTKALFENHGQNEPTCNRFHVSGNRMNVRQAVNDASSFVLVILAFSTRFFLFRPLSFSLCSYFKPARKYSCFRFSHPIVASFADVSFKSIYLKMAFYKALMFVVIIALEIYKLFTP